MRERGEGIKSSELYLYITNTFNVFFNFIYSLATYNEHAGMQTSHIQPTDDIFNSNDPCLKEVLYCTYTQKCVIERDTCLKNKYRISLQSLCNIYKMKVIMPHSPCYMMKPTSNGRKERSVHWR